MLCPFRIQVSTIREQTKKSRGSMYTDVIVHKEDKITYWLPCEKHECPFYNIHTDSCMRGIKYESYK